MSLVGTPFCAHFHNQVLAADEDEPDDDKECQDESQFPSSDAEEEEQPAGAPVEEAPEIAVREQRRVRGIARPVSLTKTQLRKHNLYCLANYNAGCPYCVSCRGLANRHERRDRQARREEHQEDEAKMPTVSLEFCFLCQKDQGKSIPTMVAREHRTCYTNYFT